MKYLLIPLLLVSILACTNYCNAHGSCEKGDRCACFPGWGAADCSERMTFILLSIILFIGVCPFGEAFVDQAVGDLDHNGAIDETVVKTEWYPHGRAEMPKEERPHFYAECSNAGICNRRTGECECFPGYGGEDCGRTLCPNSNGTMCTGHGVCMSAYMDTYMKGNIYYGWEMEKYYKCKCDKGWTGVDCSERECPKGADPFETPAKNYYTYYIKRNVDHRFVLDDFDGVTYQTVPIVKREKACDASISSGQIADFKTEIERALRGMPPFSQATVSVECGTYPLGTTAPTDPTNDDRFYNYKVTITLDYIDSALLRTAKLSIETRGYETGSLPAYDWSVAEEYKQNDQTSNRDYPFLLLNMGYEDITYECSRKGLCNYETGECQCFGGYYGVACENIKSLPI